MVINYIKGLKNVFRSGMLPDNNMKILIIAVVVLLSNIFAMNCIHASNSIFTVISEGYNYTEIEFNLPEYMTIPVEVDGVKYNRLYHSDAGYLMNERLPEVITFSFTLSIPKTGIVIAEEPKIISSHIIKNYQLFPSQGYDLEICEDKGFLIDENVYQQDKNYPELIVQVSEPSIMRDTRLVSITLYPFAYNPAREELTIREKLTVKLNYNLSAAGYNEIIRTDRKISRNYERIQRGLVINYDQFRNPNIEYQPSSILIIHHHTEGITDLVNDFSKWKRDKGFHVTVTNTANMTTAVAIKNYISNAYHNWDIPPEFIVLIGDGGDGVLTIPTSGYGETDHFGDHYYTLLDGNDDLADVIVGRISVPNRTGLATVWNKIRNYERTPYIQQTGWYNDVSIIADLFSHGPPIPNASPLFVVKYIKEMMLAYNNDYRINEIYQAPYAAQMEQALNQGCLFFWYRGAYGGSGWVASESLTNGYKTPNACYITCQTLNYNGGGQTEPIFRVGTPTVSKGAVSAIGYTGAVNTGPGNALAAGSLRGIYVDGLRTMGEALVYSKTHLWQIYGNSHPARARYHSMGGALIGDPSMNIWVDVPKSFNVTYPQTLPFGSNSIVISVTDEDDVPIEGAWVTIRQDDDAVLATGYTGADGISTRFFNPDSDGTVRVTVTKPDYKPHLGSFQLTGTPSVSYHNVVVNGELNAGNQVGFIIVAKNYRQQAANTVIGTITTNNPYINIENGNSTFGNIGAGITAESNTAFVIQISPETPSNHKVIFNLTLNDNAQNSWVSRFLLTIRNGNLVKHDLDILDDGNDGVLDPLEAANLKFYIKNTGDFTIPNVQGRLSGFVNGLSILDATAFYGDIASDQIVSSTDNHFRVSTSAYLLPGMILELELELFNEEGFSQTHSIKIPIGTVTVNTPLGPDEYGYWIYDDGDEGFMDSTEYDWVEIAPNQGGFDGVALDIEADYDNIQGIQVVELPFPFTFYGVQYEEVTISANGWISFGRTEQGTQRNWRLPGVLGPSPIVAAFWDNLSLSHGDIYTYYWEDREQFIIQWENTRNVLGNAINTFQIILYNPSFYFTRTFDGPIKIQYKIFNNVNNGADSPSGIGNWGNYCTIGIANHLDNIGLEYTFNNRYPTAAKPITNETALFITTGLGSAMVTIDSFSINDGNNNIPEYGETVTINMNLKNVGIEEAIEVNAILNSEDPYITVLQNERFFGDFDLQEVISIENAFTIEIANNVPHRHKGKLKLVLTAEDNLSWSYGFDFIISAPSLVTLPSYVYDPLPLGNNNGLLDPGEDAVMFLPIKNIGATTPPINLNITCHSELVTINSISEPHLSSINSEETLYPEIRITISEEADIGVGIPFSYSLDTGEYTFQGRFTVGIGGISPVRMGSGETVSDPIATSPINIFFRSNRSQFIYTVEEFNEAGIYGEFPINEFGFYVQASPAYSLPNFVVRMRHTRARDVSSHDADSLFTVYSSGSYSPVSGDWDLLTLDNRFMWNGVDNLLIDTAFAPVERWNTSGQIRIYDSPVSYRFTRGDNDQTNVGTNTISRNKPQALLMMGIDPETAAYKPQNLVAESTTTSVSLSWQEPLRNNRGFLQRRKSSDNRDTNAERNPTYNVYRNGILLNEIPLTEIQFQDTGIEGYTTYYYYVTAINNNKESNPSNIVSIEARTVSRLKLTPESGIYYEPIEVSITTETEDSIIYYTLDGSEPSEEDNLYETPFAITYHTELRAKAIKDDYLDSRIITGQYYILNAPRNIVGIGTFNSVNVTWQEPLLPDDFIRFGDNVSVISESFNNYSKSSRNKSINRESQVRGTLLGYNVYRSLDSENFVKLNDTLIQDTEINDLGLDRRIYYYYVRAVYVLGESNPSEIMPVGVGVVTKPIFSHKPDVYQGSLELTISNTTLNSTTYYTLNGEDPNEESPVFSNDPIIIDVTTTVKAYSTRIDWDDSEISSGLFTIVETSCDEDDITPLLKTELFSAYPNPFNPSTKISFALKEDDRVVIDVYNILGQKVITLLHEYMPSGNHSVFWNGKDTYGRNVSSGVYFYRMKTLHYNAVRKMLMIK